MMEKSSLPFQYSLATLILAVVGVGALGGSVICLVKEYLGYRHLVVNHDYLHPQPSELHENMFADWNSGKYPGSLDELEEKSLINGRYWFYVNPTCAELDVGYYTIRGLTLKNAGAIWLYENLPEPAHPLGRYVLRVHPEGGCTKEHVSETEFQKLLAQTLTNPNTAIVGNSRSQSKFARNRFTCTSDRIVFPETRAGPVVREFGKWRAILSIRAWPWMWNTSTSLFCIAIIAFSLMVWRWHRIRKAKANHFTTSSTSFDTSCPPDQ